MVHTQVCTHTKVGRSFRSLVLFALHQTAFYGNACCAAGRRIARELGPTAWTPPDVAADLTQEDFMKAVRKIAENKKLEGKVDYAKV